MPELRSVPLAELRVRALLKTLSVKAFRLCQLPRRGSFTMEINFPNKGFPRSGEAVTAGD